MNVISYHFGTCQIDAEQRILTVSGIPLDVEPRVFDLILFLIENSPTLQTREMLIKSVWKGRVVTDSAISVAVNAARKAIGDSGRTQNLIKTVPKHGFRFIADVKKVIHPVGHDLAKTSLTATSKNREKAFSVQQSVPTIVIVPGVVFERKDDSFAIAYIDDIATELSRFHTLRILSPGTTFTTRFRTLDAHSIFQEYSVNYIVSVSFRAVGNQYIIKASITDTNVCVIDSIEKSVSKSDLQKSRDSCVSMVVSSVSTAITEQEIQRCRDGNNTSPNAYTCLLRGLYLYKLGEVSVKKSRQALQWFERALKLDPTCARAHAWRECCAVDFEPDATNTSYIQRTRNRLEHALDLNPNDHEVHRVCGGLYCIAREHDLSEYHLSKAAELNPNDPRVLLRAGFYRSFVSEQLNDLVYIDQAFKLNPDRPAHYYYDRGVAAFNNKLYTQALANLTVSNVATVTAHLFKTACLKALGRDIEAAAGIKQIKNKYPETVENDIANQYPFVCYDKNDRGKNLFTLLIDAGW